MSLLIEYGLLPVGDASPEEEAMLSEIEKLPEPFIRAVSYAAACGISAFRTDQYRDLLRIAKVEGTDPAKLANAFGYMADGRHIFEGRYYLHRNPATKGRPFSLEGVEAGRAFLIFLLFLGPTAHRRIEVPVEVRA